MNLRELLWQLLLWGALPAWMAAGAADWLCHRRTRIERTSGPKESALHLLLYAQITLPVMLALFLEITAAMLLIMAAGVAAHMLTSWWDTSFSQPRRYIAPIEQLVHSWLEMVPMFALIVVAVLHVDELREPRWLLLARGADLAPAVRASVLAALLLGVLPILEEWSRGFRYARLNAAEAREPVADPRP